MYYSRPDTQRLGTVRWSLGFVLTGDVSVMVEYDYIALAFTTLSSDTEPLVICCK